MLDWSQSPPPYSACSGFEETDGESPGMPPNGVMSTPATGHGVWDRIKDKGGLLRSAERIEPEEEKRAEKKV